MARKEFGLMLAVLPGVAARTDPLIAAGHGADDVAILAVDPLKRRAGAAAKVRLEFSMSPFARGEKPQSLGRGQAGTQALDLGTFVGAARESGWQPALQKVGAGGTVFEAGDGCLSASAAVAGISATGVDDRNAEIR